MIPLIASFDHSLSVKKKVFQPPFKGKLKNKHNRVLIQISRENYLVSQVEKQGHLKEKENQIDIRFPVVKLNARK